FQFISAHAALSAQVTGFEVASLFAPPFELSDGSGPLDMDLALDHGVFSPESTMKLRAVHVGWSGGDHAGLEAAGQLLILAGGANAHGHMFPVSTDETGAAHVALDLPVLSVSIADSKILPLRLRNAGGFLSVTSADVTKTWQRAAAVLWVDQAKIDD